jgi:putative FmdB family regulatory protein
MPIYLFECQQCHKEFEIQVRMSEVGFRPPCPDCGGEVRKRVVPTQFVLKGDDWPSKAFRSKTQMARRRSKVGQKEKDHVGTGPKLVPNVGGEETDSWSEARKLAASKGKAAETYTPLVEKEKRG